MKNLFLNGFLVRPRLDPLAREQIAELKNKNVGNVGEKTQAEKLSVDEEPGEEKTVSPRGRVRGIQQGEEKLQLLFVPR